ncbi:hypothetical protein ACFLX9_04315 [Chloroflexota bacterium]
MELFREPALCPGIRQDMLAKAGNLPADVLIPDLKDYVPGGEKEDTWEVVWQVGVKRTCNAAVADATGLAGRETNANVPPQTVGCS